jgi:hypothetical protein
MISYDLKELLSYFINARNNFIMTELGNYSPDPYWHTPPDSLLGFAPLDVNKQEAYRILVNISIIKVSLTGAH